MTPCARSAWQTSRPSASGRPMSTTATSGGRSVEAGEQVASGRRPPSPRTPLREARAGETPRRSASSSTTSTRGSIDPVSPCTPSRVVGHPVRSRSGSRPRRSGPRQPRRGTLRAMSTRSHRSRLVAARRRILPALRRRLVRAEHGGLGSVRRRAGDGRRPQRPGGQPGGRHPRQPGVRRRTSPPDGAYAVKVPEGWARTRAQAAHAFTDKLNASACRPRPPRGADRRVGAGRRGPTLAASAPATPPATVTQVHREAGNAVLITYQADAPPDPVTGKVGARRRRALRVLAQRHEVVLTLSGPGRRQRRPVADRHRLVAVDAR